MCHAGRRNKSGIVAVYMALTYPPKNSTPEGDGGRHSSTNAREKIREMEVEKLRQLFRDIDNDGSGTLDRLEVKFLARKLGKKMSTTEVEAAFSEMDPSVRERRRPIYHHPRCGLLLSRSHSINLCAHPINSCHRALVTSRGMVRWILTSL